MSCLLSGFKVPARQTHKSCYLNLNNSFVSSASFVVAAVSQSVNEAVGDLWAGTAYLVELKELLFEPIPLGLLAVSSEPLHPVSAAAWSRSAHQYRLEQVRKAGDRVKE